MTLAIIWTLGILLSCALTFREMQDYVFFRYSQKSRGTPVKDFSFYIQSSALTFLISLFWPITLLIYLIHFITYYSDVYY